MARREQIMRRHKQILKSSSVFSLIVPYSSHPYFLTPPFLSEDGYELRQSGAWTNPENV